jgi:hypothetical protein
MDKNQRRFAIVGIDDRRHACANGHGMRIVCAFQRMLMQLMNPSMR